MEDDQAGRSSPRQQKKIHDDPLNPDRTDSYTIALVCTLPIAMAAACAMLDKVHERLPRGGNDSNSYVLGSIQQHNVVILCPPEGDYGGNSITKAFIIMGRTLRNIQLALLIGIGGGAPRKADLRLGDIVVGTKVIQKDIGTATSETFLIEPVPLSVGKVVSSLRSKHYSSSSRVPSILRERSQQLRGFERPVSADRLFTATYHHDPSIPDCAGCDQSALVERRPRDSDDPVIHYGAIASGNRIIRDSYMRDKLAQDLDVICFEFEAAGVTVNCPWLLIRGICDYSDSHKTKEWQRYAAATAAAYAREFLEELSVSQRQQHGSWRTRVHLEEKDKECLRDLRITNPEDDKERIVKVRGGLLVESYRWVMENKIYQEWAKSKGSRLLWVKGGPGMGKTMLLCGLINELERSTDSDNVFYFFCESHELRLRSASAVLRGLIWFLARRRPNLITYVRNEYDQGGKDVFDNGNALQVLSNIMTLMLDDESTDDCIFVVDALDECSDDRESLIELVNQFSSTSKSRWIVSSRNWPEVETQLGAVAANRVVLELNHSSIAEAVETFIRFRVEHLAERKQYPESIRVAVLQYLFENADNNFLWVSLVCEELGKFNVLPHHTLKILESFPVSLDKLYQRMLNKLLQSADEEICRAILAVVTFAPKPLSLTELAASDERLIPFQSDLPALFNIVTYCGSFLNINNNVVEMVHQSVKEYLLASSEIFPPRVETDLYTVPQSTKSGLVTPSEFFARSVDSDLASLWSEGGSMSSTAPSSLLQGRRDGVGLLATLLLNDDDLGPLYSEASTRVTSKKLTRHLHGFLREYGIGLIHEARSGIQKQAAEFVSSHAVYMAREIIELLNAKNSDSHKLQLPREPPEKTRHMINEWLDSARDAERITEVPSDRGIRRSEAEEDEATLAVDEEHNPVIYDSKETYDALELARDFLLSAEAFRDLQRDFRNWVKQDDWKDTTKRQSIRNRQHGDEETLGLSKSDMKQPSSARDDTERRLGQLSDPEGMAILTESSNRDSTTAKNVEEVAQQKSVGGLDVDFSEANETSPLLEIERQEIVDSTWNRLNANLWYRLMAILDPTPNGAHRVTYTCECGSFQYLDVEELVPGGAVNFQQAIRDAASAVRQQTSTSNTVANPTSTYHQNHNLSNSSTETETVTQSHQHGSTISRTLGTRAMATSREDSVASSETRYVLICVNTKYGYARLEHADVSKIDGDEGLFEEIRTKYYGARQEHEWTIARFILEKVCSRSLFQQFGEGRLLIPGKMEFTQFRLHPVGTKICTGYMVKPRIPSKQEMNKEGYEYLPVPQDITILKIPAHPLLKPGKHLDSFWQNTFPKKRGTMLEYVSQADPPYGWGIHISEDWNKPLTTLLISLLVVFFGGFVIIYGIVSKDWGTGATIGSFFVALYVLCCTFHYQWWMRK